MSAGIFFAEEAYQYIHQSSFPFLTSLIALLEPDLAPFKDWEEIGDIWEISLNVASAAATPAPKVRSHEGSNLVKIVKIVKIS